MAYERISPTAWLVAYQRTLSDIPLSAEIFEELEKIVRQDGSDSDTAHIDALKSSAMAVMWEARFKILNHVLKTHRPKQVLEIAAGFSPRGLALAQDPAVSYVEVDLPGLIQEKRHIIDTLVARGKISDQPNIHLVEGNALDLQDLLAATQFYDDKPIAIINEGLLPYLDRAERTTLANNVRALLERFGGSWITPDIDLQLPEGSFGQINEQVKKRTARIELLTGIDVLKNRFESEEAATAFFEELGFEVERHSFMEIADQLALSPQASLAKKAIERGILFDMSLEDR